MFTPLDKYFTRINIRTYLIFVIIILVSLGAVNHFIQDDAFISFRYAENFANGHGLTWNIGEQDPVEGYTNFLWVLMIALGFTLHIDPIFWSAFLGLFFAVGTLVTTFKLASLLYRSYSIAFIAVILLGTNYSFSSYMTGGLETQLQTFLVVASVYITFETIQNEKYDNFIRMTGISIIYSLAILTRLDSVLFCFIPYFILTKFIWKSSFPKKMQIISQFGLSIPAVVILGSWFLFKILYYGDILPNTFYAKASSFNLAIIGRSLWYIGSFIINYSFIIFLPFIFLFQEDIKRTFSKQNIRILLITISVWILYIFGVGGDFMEYRFFIPILPFLYIFFAKILQLTQNVKVQVSLFIILLLSSANHAITFKGSYFGIESIRSLNARVFAEDQNWQGVGIKLAELFSSSEEPVVIATSAAGAIPYYSKLQTIDMVGLNDKWVARNGEIISTRPGHIRFATLEYLLYSNVNLVLGHPLVSLKTSHPFQNPQEYLFISPNTSLLPDTAKIIEIPLNEEYKISVLYLHSHKKIDETIINYNLNTYEVLP